LYRLSDLIRTTGEVTMSTRPFWSSAILTASLGFGLAASAQTQQPAPAASPPAAFPDTPIGRAVNEWMDAFNSADSARLGAFYRKYKLERSMEQQMARRRASGGFDLVSIDRSEPRLIEMVLKERATGKLAVGVMQLSAASEPTLTQSALAGVPPGGSVADFKIDAATRKRVVEAAIAKLDSNYVFPDVAAKMAASVRGRLQRGEYDNLDNGITFAARLTEDFTEVSKDKHLRVNFSPAPIPDRPANAEPSPEQRERYRRDMEAVNCGFAKPERLPGNIGLLKFDFFARPDICGPTATSAMNELADVNALIVDLRSNGGGDPSMVAFVSSYLFSKRTHLNDLWTRRTNETKEYWTQPDAPGKKLGDSVPVYVLTSSRTFSGAEEFSYNLKNLKRATIIGETTGGGAHPVSGHKITDHFMIGVPFARAINPYSKTNWEGTGVEPDVKVPAGDALATAQKMIKEKSSRVQ
jgi:retinol-binding protein 3